ncbi:uncharacterized protein PRCAT00006078001 [Priceomyces carsonii]|uniref:uncharacterized protein n=1 Tax=Priceomyces carsonii TaxID=28549 RepID=UPI002ED984F0|nr:unnamed protein product [Priceomyces carsonii]
MTSSIDMKALTIFIQSPVSLEMIHKLVVATLQVLPCQESKGYNEVGGKPLPSLMTFITKLVRYTNVYTGTLMACLVYLNRLKEKLPKNAQGIPCTRHRILLSCLILAAKYHNDSSPKNVHWAKYTDGLFNLKDINLMERQLMYLLNWDLRVSNEEMIEHLDLFLTPIKLDLINSNKVRKHLQRQKYQRELQKHQRQQANKLQVPAHNNYLSSTVSSASSSLASPISRSPSSVVSRSSSNSSLSLRHYRQDSSSSLSSVSSPEMIQTSLKVLLPERIDPIIELTARNEEVELNRMLRLLQPRATT